MNQTLLRSLITLGALLFTAHDVTAQSVAPLDEARAALQINDLAKAEALLVPLTGADAKDATAFFVLGQLRERQQNKKGAVAAYEQATKTDPTKPEYFARLAIALSQRIGEVSFMEQAVLAGKMKKAFEKTVELDPHNVTGLIGLARYYGSAPEIAGGSIVKAREFAQRILELDPFLGEVELGIVAEQDEKYAEALEHFEAAVAQKPERAAGQNLCGRVLAKLGRKAEARERFESALKLDPKLESARKSLADLNVIPTP